MRLRYQHLAGIAHTVVKALQSLPEVRVTGTPAALAEEIQALLEASIAEERALEEEAHRLLHQQLKKTGAQIDESRAFQMIKKELAKKKGVVL